MLRRNRLPSNCLTWALSICKEKKLEFVLAKKLARVLMSYFHRFFFIIRGRRWFLLEFHVPWTAPLIKLVEQIHLISWRTFLLLFFRFFWTQVVRPLRHWKNGILDKLLPYFQLKFYSLFSILCKEKRSSWLKTGLVWRRFSRERWSFQIVWLWTNFWHLDFYWATIGSQFQVWHFGKNVENTRQCFKMCQSQKLMKERPKKIRFAVFSTLKMCAILILKLSV